MSVPPESHSPRPASSSAPKHPQKVSVERQRKSSSSKDAKKSKSDEADGDGIVGTYTDATKKAKNKTPKKTLTTILEKEEMSMTPNSFRGSRSASPDPSTGLNSSKSPTPDLRAHRKPTVCPKNTPLRLHRHSYKPGCAMAAWVGQQCAERPCPDSFAAHYLGRKNVCYRPMAEKYSVKSTVMMNDPKLHDNGKLLYKRAQTGKNMLESIAHSMKMTPGLTFRRPQAPPPRSSREMSQLPAPPSPPPPVFRLTHNRGSKMR